MSLKKVVKWKNEEEHWSKDVSLGHCLFWTMRRLSTQAEDKIIRYRSQVLYFTLTTGSPLPFSKTNNYLWSPILPLKTPTKRTPRLVLPHYTFKKIKKTQKTKNIRKYWKHLVGTSLGSSAGRELPFASKNAKIATVRSGCCCASSLVMMNPSTNWRRANSTLDPWVGRKFFGFVFVFF